MSIPTPNEQRGPSLWAVILILVGAVWLLTQANIITGENLSVLFRMWPILLIGIGLELLFGRRSRTLSTLIILGTIAILIILMIVGPSLGLASNTEVKTAQYSEPLDDAESAQITVSAGVGDLEVSALDDPSELFDADIRYVGEVQYEAENEGTTKVVTLENESGSVNWVNFADIFNWFDDENTARWDVGINQDVPVDLSLSTGTGGATLDLSELHLTGLSVNSGTGGITLTMPVVEGERYDAHVSLGTGGATITLEDGIATDLRINSGTGGVTIDVPQNAAVRLDADSGTGGISVPSEFERVSGDEDNNVVGDSGVWETANYAEAEENFRIDIQFDGGTGGLTVR